MRRVQKYIVRILLSAVLCFVPRIPAAAVDFGLVLNPEGGYVSDTEGKGFDFTAGLRPWFSSALGEKADIYFSGKLTFEYEYETSAWADPPLAELERTELDFRPASWIYLALGRQYYADSGALIVAGLFDGISGAFSFSAARVSLGAFYTGFQYKETAEILMTQEDRGRYSEELDYGDPDTYFASRRVLLSLDLEFPDLFSRFSPALGGLAQTDVNGDDGGGLHSQYLEARFGIDAADSLRLNLAGVLARMDDRTGDTLRTGCAAAFGLEWDVPGALRDMLGADLRWGNGQSGNGTGAFIPVSTIARGTVFSPGLYGLMDARAFYTVRPHTTLSMSCGVTAFWRTDLETFGDTELEAGSKNRFLGTEIYGSAVWAPDSVLRFTAGGGVFLPGGAFTENADPRWEIRTGLILSL
jgi:hypothetical protein